MMLNNRKMKKRNTNLNSFSNVSPVAAFPVGWRSIAADPYYKFSRHEFTSEELPADMDPLLFQRCLAFLGTLSAPRITCAEDPSVPGSESGTMCPICGLVARDTWTKTRSGRMRRQIRIETLREHMGMRHYLMRRVPCPAKGKTKCASKGYAKGHRLLRHLADNIECHDVVSKNLEVEISVAEAIHWALGSPETPGAKEGTASSKKMMRDLFTQRVNAMRKCGVPMARALKCETGSDAGFLGSDAGSSFSPQPVLLDEPSQQPIDPGSFNQFAHDHQFTDIHHLDPYAQMYPVSTHMDLDPYHSFTQTPQTIHHPSIDHLAFQHHQFQNEMSSSTPSYSLHLDSPYQPSPLRKPFPGELSTPVFSQVDLTPMQSTTYLENNPMYSNNNPLNGPLDPVINGHPSPLAFSSADQSLMTLSLPDPFFNPYLTPEISADQLPSHFSTPTQNPISFLQQKPPTSIAASGVDLMMSLNPAVLNSKLDAPQSYIPSLSTSGWDLTASPATPPFNMANISDLQGNFSWNMNGGDILPSWAMSAFPQGGNGRKQKAL